MKRIAGFYGCSSCFLRWRAAGPPRSPKPRRRRKRPKPMPVFALVVKDTVNPYMQVMYNGFKRGL